MACMAVWLYRLYVLYTLYILTGEPGQGVSAVFLYYTAKSCILRWTVFETFERLFHPANAKQVKHTPSPSVRGPALSQCEWLA